MNNIKQKLLVLLTAIAVIFGASFITPSVASANVFLSATTCVHSSAKFICMDVSASTITIKGNGPTATYPAGYSGGAPTKGFLAYDLYGCNADASNNTGFAVTQPNNANLPASIVFSDDLVVYNGKVSVSSSLEATIAWLANSQTGYNCIIVP